ncbi:hypothetical protein [Streptomyces zhihengii]
MKTAGRRRAVPALLPVLLGTAACGSGTEEAPGEAVYGAPLAQQFHAATAATREAGTSRFLATLTYATSGAKTVERASGTQDYAARTSSATHELHIPADFPEKDAGYIGEAARVAVATAGDDVYVRRDDSSWLRYSPAAFTALGDGAEELSVHAAGEVAPWSGTLADLVPRSVPREEPRREKDGSRVYEVTALPENAAGLLPSSVKAGPGDSWGDEQVPMTVRLDAHGRLSEVTADLRPLLDILHEDGILKEVTGLRASYTLSEFGEPVDNGVPAEGVEDAEKTVAVLDALDPGRCADHNTGVASRMVVRTVDCSAPHDVLVIAQVVLDETIPGKKTDKAPDWFAEKKCDTAFAEAPDSLLRESRLPGKTLAYAGSAVQGLQVAQGQTSTTVTGTYTCFIVDEDLTER